ncbi:hypothetical protein LIA77_02282 [Sarocladium implicatum]|nr:hypothetical protein LIA77_02282 [Sarocladium implicatum]
MLAGNWDILSAINEHLRLPMVALLCFLLSMTNKHPNTSRHVKADPSSSSSEAGAYGKHSNTLKSFSCSTLSSHAALSKRQDPAHTPLSCVQTTGSSLPDCTAHPCTLQAIMSPSVEKLQVRYLWSSSVVRLLRKASLASPPRGTGQGDASSSLVQRGGSPLTRVLTWSDANWATEPSFNVVGGRTMSDAR